MQKHSIFNDFYSVFDQKIKTLLPWKWAIKIGVPIDFFSFLDQGEHAQKVP